MYRLYVLLVLVSFAREVYSCYILESGIDDSDQQLIVEAHNHYRSQVAKGLVPGQPIGSNILRMCWDMDLAREAQTVAETCEYEQVDVFDDRFDVGQNIFTSSDFVERLGANWTMAIEAWFNGHFEYDFGVEQYDNYTQLIWADTYLVGCGYTQFQIEEMNQKLYVCNYGPAGNIWGELPYEVGSGCLELCSPPV